VVLGQRHAAQQGAQRRHTERLMRDDEGSRRTPVDGDGIGKGDLNK
jgi:hypothetical protein